MEKGKITDVKLVLIGGSAGSLEVLMQVVPLLNPFTTFAMVIVLHRKNAKDSALEELIAYKTEIPVQEVEDKTPLVAGNIYIAPSDYHLLFEGDGLLSLDDSEKVNYSRPSIDVSFESAAEVFKNNVLAILLSGANADGTAGLQAVGANGGIVVVQEPTSAEIPFMVQNAIDNLTPNHILSPDGITRLINELSPGYL